ncbi:MAG: WhiB family transcriptional regulator [Trebonia sp.]
MIEFAADWRAAGACLSADPDLFFPVATGVVAKRQISRALRVCAGCAVRRQCLDFAVSTGEESGVWGGTTAEERIRARRKNGAAAGTASPCRRRRPPASREITALDRG